MEFDKRLSQEEVVKDFLLDKELTSKILNQYSYFVLWQHHYHLMSEENRIKYFPDELKPILDESEIRKYMLDHQKKWDEYLVSKNVKIEPVPNIYPVMKQTDDDKVRDIEHRNTYKDVPFFELIYGNTWGQESENGG